MEKGQFFELPPFWGRTMMNTKQIATKHNRNRVLASIVALLLLLGLVPLSVLAEGYTKQGDALKVNMVDPGADFITTSRLENGDYLNEISIGYDSTNPVVFTVDIGDGSGTNHLELKEFENYIKVFKSKELTEENLLYTFGKDTELTMTDIGGQTTLQRGRKYELSVSGLEKGSTYYLAFMAGMQSAQRGAQLGSHSIIFQFSTLEDPDKPNQVVLDQQGVILEGIGQTFLLNATVLPEAATNKSVKWSSSDAAVASVDATGTVTAKKAGEATITVTTVEGEKTAFCLFVVKDTASTDTLTKVSGTQILKSEAKFTIDEPEVYRSSKTGDYVVPDEVELKALPEIHITMIPNGGRQSTTFNPHVYADAALTEELAKNGDGIAAVVPDFTSGTFTIDPAKLGTGKTYYFTLDKRSTCGGVALGEDVIIEFTVKAGDSDDPTPTPTHTHNWETVPAVEATCTASGLTEGVRCSECGEWQKEQTVVPMKDHTPETIAAVQPTCTEDGKTEGKKCSVCGTILEEPKTIAKLGHKYVDGVCERCNEKDPDYKPTPVEPVTKFTGLANEADKDGVWWYYTDGKIDKTHTGVDKNKYGWWRVENGKINFNAQSIYQNSFGWWKTTNGKVTFKEEGVFQNNFGWWRVKDSKVDFNAQSIYQNKFGWWKTTNGKVTFKENGLFKNQYGTWKVENSKVNFNYNGTYQGKTIKNGKVQ